MAYTIPQFVLPLTTSDSATIRLTLANSGALGAPAVVDAVVPAGTYRNDRQYGVAGNLAGDVAGLLEAAETAAGTNGTWTASEVTSGTLKGRTNLTRTKVVGDVVTSLETVDTSIIPKEWLGWSADSVAPTALTLTGEYWDAAHMAKGLWIPHAIDTILMTRDQSYREDVVVVTETPTGASSQDYWGGVVRRDVDVSFVHAASVWPHYLAQTLYADTIGAQTSDKVAAWDYFRQYWRDLDSTERICRFSSDYTAPGTYTEVIPRGDWIGTTNSIVTVVNESPLILSLSIALTEV